MTSSATVIGAGGELGNARIGNSKELAYVNVHSGNLFLNDHDDFIASLGVNVDLTHICNSSGSLNDGNGANWKLDLKRIVNLTRGTPGAANSTLRRIAADGSASEFTWDGVSAGVSRDGGAYQSIVTDFMLVARSTSGYATYWSGPGGPQYRRAVGNYTNVNPCPAYFTDVQLFAAAREGDGGSLEFELQTNASFTLRDLDQRFPRLDVMTDGDEPTKLYFTYGPASSRFDAQIIAFFKSTLPSPAEQPMVVIVRRSVR